MQFVNAHKPPSTVLKGKVIKVIYEHTIRKLATPNI